MLPVGKCKSYSHSHESRQITYALNKLRQSRQNLDEN